MKLKCLELNLHSKLKFHELEFQKSGCKDSICNDPKLVLGSNAKSPNNKFVERGYKRTILTSKEKLLYLTFLDGLIQIL